MGVIGTKDLKLGSALKSVLKCIREIVIEDVPCFITNFCLTVVHFWCQVSTGPSAGTVVLLRNTV